MSNHERVLNHAAGRQRAAQHVAIASAASQMSRNATGKLLEPVRHETTML